MDNDRLTEYVTLTLKLLGLDYQRNNSSWDTTMDLEFNNTLKELDSYKYEVELYLKKHKQL